MEQSHNEVMRRAAPLAPSGFQAPAIKDISGALTMVLADVFALYLKTNNFQLLASMRAAHSLCDEYGDVATAGLLKNWIDRAEERVWFLFEACRSASREEQE